jgi:ketosteroid isomerase-like protein
MSRLKPPQATLLASADDVEAQFYEAMQQGDLARLMAVWADDDDIVCVHPGGTRMVGAAAIRAGFEAIFSGGGVPAVPEQVRRLQHMGLAVHHLVERIHLAVAESPGGADRTATRRTEAQAWVMATNVYINTAQGWRLVAHHASPGAAEPPVTAVEWPSTLH